MEHLNLLIDAMRDAGISTTFIPGSMEKSSAFMSMVTNQVAKMAGLLDLSIRALRLPAMALGKNLVTPIPGVQSLLIRSLLKSVKTFNVA